jgi:hypothetical protein
MMMETAAAGSCTLHHRSESNPTQKTLLAFLGNLCRPIAPNVNTTSTSSKRGKENKRRDYFKQHFHMSAAASALSRHSDQIQRDLQEN